MLPINRLLEYQAEVCATLLDDNTNKLFNYSTMIVDDSELSKVLEERTDEESAFLISVVPSFNLSGAENASKWNNTLLFFILEKTDYSAHDRDTFLDIFTRTQSITQQFVDKLLEDKADNNSLFCGFLSWLNEEYITVDPVWKKQGCNGWMVQINLETI